MATEYPVILVVEDEPDIAELISYVLQSSGFECHVAGSVAAAVGYLKDKRPSLAMLDYMLPDGNGLGLLSYIREEDRLSNLPVVMLTARSVPEDRAACMGAGANDYITKPFSPAELCVRIKAILLSAGFLFGACA
ncbi:response regulator [Herbaspirillum sp. HC18]|nr:response regulator [Herbaspirillum sp. HC18]